MIWFAALSIERETIARICRPNLFASMSAEPFTPFAKWIVWPET